MKILKFGAIWCNGCAIMRPRWGQIQKEYPWLETEFYDYDRDRDVAERYDIQEVPTVVFLDNNGKEFLRLSGEISKDKIVDIITSNEDRWPKTEDKS